MSPLREPAQTHPRVISPPVIHTIPPYPVTTPKVGRVPPPQLPPPQWYNIRKCRKQAPTIFVSPITGETIQNLVNHQVANYVINSKTRVTQEYKQLIKSTEKDTWNTSFTNELGRLAQGIEDRLPTGI